MAHIGTSRPTAQARREMPIDRNNSPVESSTLIIDYANFKGSRSRETKFLDFNKQTEGWRQPDIIVGSDPSQLLPWSPLGDYHLVMRTSRTLVETDNPNDPNWRYEAPPHRSKLQHGPTPCFCAITRGDGPSFLSYTPLNPKVIMGFPLV
ncbi:hypothetical protein FSST1_002607 [Fusarium sambucinum]